MYHYVTLRVSIFFLIYHFLAPCQVTLFRLHMLERKKRIIKEKGKSRTYFIKSGHAVLKINYNIKL